MFIRPQTIDYIRLLHQNDAVIESHNIMKMIIIINIIDFNTVRCTLV